MLRYHTGAGEGRPDVGSVTASEARKRLFPLIEQVNEDREPVEITSRRGDAVLVAKADYDALVETAYLLRAPANARRLLESLEQARRGEREEHPLG
jgi:antitoxin YefM